MTNARNLAFIVSISLAALAFGSANEARAERRQPLTSAKIRQVMSKHAPALRDCYLQHVTQQGPTGTLTLEILVRASGQVAGVEVEALASDQKKLEQCVLQLSKRWRFPRSSDETLVKYPMMFVHTQGAGAAAEQASAAPPRAQDGARARVARGGRSRP
jgi:TonB family protein